MLQFYAVLSMLCLEGFLVVLFLLPRYGEMC